MASSDDEADVGPQSVSNYHLVTLKNSKDEAVSLAALPIQWSGDKSVGGNRKEIHLRGSADNGLQTVFIPVVAWKFDLTNITPEISVLAKGKGWIKLLKPRKAYEEIIRTILITVQCLSYAKRNPEVTATAVWHHLSKVFRSFEVRPSQNDLVDHRDLISEALKRDDSLAKSKFLRTFLEEKPKKKKLFDEDVKSAVKSGFIVDDAEDLMAEDPKENESDEDEDLFDSVCAFCDNGGELLCCEGRCMRSFHPTEEDGDQWCPSLGFTKEEVEAIPNFLCKNCELRKHQCFGCGKLGSSDKASGAQVYSCVSATCGRFYHPLCVSKLLFPDNEVAAKQLCKSIDGGSSFTCPIHKCYVCKEGENKTCHDLQFAVCRRCPKAYHRKCLPKEITFERVEAEEEKDLEVEEEEVPVARAWDNLLLNRRILIYCLDHEIDEELGTPIRDHIMFPGDEEKKTIVESSKKQKLELPAGKEKVLSKKSSLAFIDSSREKSVLKAPKRSLSAVERGETIRKNERLMVGSSSARKMKETATPRKPLKENAKSVSVEVDRASAGNAKKTSLGEMLFAYATQGTEETKPGKRDAPDSELNKSVKSTRMKLSSDLPELDADSKRRVLSIIKDASSSITLDSVVKKYKVPSTHVSSSKYVVDRGITLGKLEGSVEAVRTALKKLEEENGSIVDAKAVCEPEILNQIYKWKNKLRVYLAPFLHGMRYTSFGRHFTKVDKLQEIVNKLHSYVQSGDMIVDFCCGANDFSCLMKKKLEETGKKCLYKNYDIISPKNDFSFEKRDFMTVKPEELAPGSQLIMGLNPPFGVKACLANQFVNKALEFKPKLLILIVPPETERLDRKKSPYDLVWEDGQFLSGKSFYLPGSVDENEKQMDQWNLTAPPLYLWSRPDWTERHQSIAEKQGHISKQKQEESHSERNCDEKSHDETNVLDHELEEDHDHFGDTSMLTERPLQNNEAVAGPGQVAAEGHQGSFRDSASRREGPESHGFGKNHSNGRSRKRSRDDKDKKALGNGASENSVSGKQSSGNNSESEIFKGISLDSPPNLMDGKSSSLHRLGSSFDATQAYSSPTYEFSGAANMGEPFIAHTGVGPDTLGYRGYIEDVPIESDIRSQGRVYGQNPAVSTPGYGQMGSTPGYGQMVSAPGYGSYGQVGSLSYTPYRHLGSSTQVSFRMNLSAMDRYAPRLDELNQRMMGGSALQPNPSMVNRIGIYGARPPAQPGYPFDSTGFIPGPQRPYPHHNSAGWLDE